MQQDQHPVSAGNAVITFSVFLTAIAMKYGLASDPRWYQLAYISVPLLIGSVIFSRVKIVRVMMSRRENRK